MYQWLVFLHLVGVIVFAIAHGVSAFMAFQVRRQRDPRLVASHLRASQVGVGLTYVGLLMIGIGGLGAAAIGNVLVTTWAIASYVVLGIALVVMWAVAAPYYNRVRELVGDGTVALDRAELDRTLNTRRPEILVTVGTLALLVLTWLMVFRPS